MDINLISSYITQSDPNAQKLALNSFERLRTDPNGWRLCIEYALASGLSRDDQLGESGLFFCLQIIESYARNGYENDIPANQTLLREFIFRWFALIGESNTSGSRSNAVLNKFAYIVNLVFLIDWPNRRWPSFFGDFLASCRSQSACDLFLRILLQINADIADKEILHSAQELQRNSIIRDLMREACLLDLAKFWLNIISTYKERPVGLVNRCLDVIGSYVTWIEINLITNETVMASLLELFQKPAYRSNVAECFCAIVRKGMDPASKVQLIEQFFLVDPVKKAFADVVGTPDGCYNQNVRRSSYHEIDRGEDEEFKFYVKLSKFLNTIGLELMESYKKMKSKFVAGGGGVGQTSMALAHEDLQAFHFLFSAINGKIQLLFGVLSHPSIPISQAVHPYAREYITWLKTHRQACSFLPNIQHLLSDADRDEITKILLRIIIERSQIPLDSFEDWGEYVIELEAELTGTTSTINGTSGSPTNAVTGGGGGGADLDEACQQMDDYRKSLKVLFDNLLSINPNPLVILMSDQLIEPLLRGWQARIGISSEPLTSSSSSLTRRKEGQGLLAGTSAAIGPDIENALYFFYLIGENTGQIFNENNLASLLHLLVTSDVSRYPCHVTQLHYFEILLRYEKFFSSTAPNNQLHSLVPQVLVSFLDERGLKNANACVRAKVMIVFSKFVKYQLRSKSADRIQTFASEILTRVTEFLTIEASEVRHLVDQALASSATVHHVNGTNSASANSCDSNSKKVSSSTVIISESEQIACYELVAMLIVSCTNTDQQSGERKHSLLKLHLLEPAFAYFDRTMALIERSLVLLGPDGPQQLLAYAERIQNLKCPPTSPSFGSGPLAGLRYLCHRLGHVISLVAHSSKAFPNFQALRSVGSVKDDYLAAFNIFIKSVSLSNIPPIFSAPIQTSVRLLLHRLIIILDESEIVPLLPSSLETLFHLNNVSLPPPPPPSLSASPSPFSSSSSPAASSSASSSSSVSPSHSAVVSLGLTATALQELIPLVNQIVTKFKNSWLFSRDLGPFFRRSTIPILVSYFRHITAGDLTHDERQSLMKSYYSFLGLLATQNVMDAFNTFDIGSVEQIASTVLQGAMDSNEPSTQKLCFTIFKKMIEAYAPAAYIEDSQDPNVRSSMPDKPCRATIQSGFVDYMYKFILPTAFTVPYKSLVSGEAVDGATQQIVQECAICIRAALVARGADELTAFIANELLVRHFSVGVTTSPSSASSPPQISSTHQQHSNFSCVTITDFIARISAPECESNTKHLKQLLRDFLSAVRCAAPPPAAQAPRGLATSKT